MQVQARELKAKVKRRVEDRLDRAAQTFLTGGGVKEIDFSMPPGEPSLVPCDSISWRIFKNPVSLFIGGVTAVLLEFAEPRIRSGVWDHTSFKTDPVTRLRRTGLAAMITVYGPASIAAAMIDRVNKMHGRIKGVTPSGESYSALDPELLTWVQATASFGFLEANAAYVAPISDVERDAFYGEGGEASRLYGAAGAPRSLQAQRALFQEMTPRFERSDIIFEFLDIMKKAPAFPQPAQFAQHSLVRAAIELVPGDIRDTLGLGKEFGLRPLEGRVVRRMGRRADRLILRSSPPVQACRRLGLGEDYLYQRR